MLRKDNYRKSSVGKKISGRAPQGASPDIGNVWSLNIIFSFCPAKIYK
jgi:hypothetical protein